MPTQPEFWDKVAAKYDRKTVKGPNYAARLDRAVQWLGEDASILDAGCASGHITLDLARRVRKVHGIDISPKLIALANQRLEESGPDNCTFSTLSIDDAELEPGSFDAVTAYSLLHLVPDVPATVNRFYDLIRPGGRVIAEVPTKTEIGLPLRMLIKLMQAVGKAPNVRVYSQQAYRSMFEKAGFTVDDFEVYNPKSMSRSLLATKPS